MKSRRTYTPGLHAAKITNLTMRDGNRCAICGERLNPRQSDPVATDFTTLDHMVPLSKGGASTLDNLRLAHRACNNARGNRDCSPRPVVEYLPWDERPAVSPPRPVAARQSDGEDRSDRESANPLT